MIYADVRIRRTSHYNLKICMTQTSCESLDSLPVHQLYLWPVHATSGLASDASQIPYSTTGNPTTDVWQAEQRRLVHSSEKYVQYNICWIFPWKWKIYDSNLRIILYSESYLGANYWTHTHPDLCLCSPYMPYFSNKECTVFVTVAAATLNSHFSFWFTSSFSVPNLIWSCLNLSKCFMCGGGGGGLRLILSSA